MYTLIIEDRHGRSAAEISFDQGSYTIGRVDGNDVVLPSNTVSRTHARIFVSNNKCYIDDLASANGVTVDGEAIKERTEIRNGSKVRIGEYTLYLEYKDQSDMHAGQDVLKTQIVSSDQSGYKIVRVGDKFAGEAFMLSEQNNTIGRTEDNYILLSDNSISRNHARIVNSNLTYHVIDLDSSNGTFVNNKKISSEYKLHPGDQIRFGNVSFVFVPASETVDIRQYASKKRNDNRQLVLILGGGIIVLCILIVFFAIYKVKQKDSDNETAVKQEVVSAENAKADLQKRMHDVEVLFEKKHFEPARNIVTELLKENPHHAELRALNSKVEFEFKNEELLNQGIKKLENDEFEAAIDLFEMVDSDSVNRPVAEKRIEETKHDLRLRAYNDARSKCDEGTTAECVSDLCDATSELELSDQTEKARFDDTMAFMERTSKNKNNKQNSAAKRCLQRLKNLESGETDAE